MIAGDLLIRRLGVEGLWRGAGSGVGIVAQGRFGKESYRQVRPCEKRGRAGQHHRPGLRCLSRQ